MKIALLGCAPSVHTIRWANAISQRGIDLHLFTAHAADCKKLRRDVTLHQLPFSAPLGYFANGWPLARRLHQLQPDLLHAHYASGYGTLARLCGYRPLMLSVWGSDVYKVPEVSPLHRAIVRRNVQHADCVGATGNMLAEQTEHVCGQLSNLVVTPFGVDTNRFQPHHNLRSRDTFTIGTVKTLSPVYGIDILIRGFAQCRRQLLQSQHPLADKLRLLLVGGGTSREELQRLAVAEGVDDVTQFTGPVPHDQVPDYLNQLDIYVAASRSESFGVAVLEASACGLPVVVSDVGGLPEVVQRDETGLIVPTENPVAVGDALAGLVQDESLRMRLAKAGREFVVRKYDWEDNVTHMLDVYRQTIGERSMPAAA